MKGQQSRVIKIAKRQTRVGLKDAVIRTVSMARVYLAVGLTLVRLPSRRLDPSMSLVLRLYFPLCCVSLSAKICTTQASAIRINEIISAILFLRHNSITDTRCVIDKEIASSRHPCCRTLLILSPLISSQQNQQLLSIIVRISTSNSPTVSVRDMFSFRKPNH